MAGIPAGVLRAYSLAMPDIDHVLTEDRRFPPSAEFQAVARLSSEEEYQAMHRRSVDDPEGFWGEMAQELPWIEPPTEGCDWSGAPVARHKERSAKKRRRVIVIDQDPVWASLQHAHCACTRVLPLRDARHGQQRYVASDGLEGTSAGGDSTT